MHHGRCRLRSTLRCLSTDQHYLCVSVIVRLTHVVRACRLIICRVRNHHWHLAIMRPPPAEYSWENKSGNSEEGFIRLQCTTGLQSFSYAICFVISSPLVYRYTSVSTQLLEARPPPNPHRHLYDFYILNRPAFLSVLCKIRSALPLANVIAHSWRAFLFCLKGHLDALNNVCFTKKKLWMKSRDQRRWWEEVVGSLLIPLWRNRWNQDTLALKWNEMNHSLHRCKERHRLLPPIIASSPSHSHCLSHALSLHVFCVFQADALRSEASEATMSHPLRWLKCRISSEFFQNHIPQTSHRCMHLNCTFTYTPFHTHACPHLIRLEPSHLYFSLSPTVIGVVIARLEYQWQSAQRPREIWPRSVFYSSIYRHHHLLIRLWYSDR